MSGPSVPTWCETGTPAEITVGRAWRGATRDGHHDRREGWAACRPGDRIGGRRGARRPRRRSGDGDAAVARGDRIEARDGGIRPGDRGEAALLGDRIPAGGGA